MEIMRDRFIDSLKKKGETEFEVENHTRKKSFVRHFIKAMFSGDEDEKNEADESLSGEDGFREKISKDSFDENRIDDSTMLKIVKELPPERKISFIMSIFYELAGSKEHLPIVEKGSWGLTPTEISNSNEKICTEMQSDHTDITNESFGNDNKGPDFSETEVSPYHLDHETSKTSIGDDGPLSQAIRNNEKTLVISDDPESAPPVTPAPKTVRAWLKDPRLYMVIFNSLSLNVKNCFECLVVCLFAFLLLSSLSFFFLSLFFESYKPFCFWPYLLSTFLAWYKCQNL